MSTNITLQIITEAEGRIVTTDLPGTYSDRERAMRAAKKAAGRGAQYTGDGISLRYSGPVGTVYLCGATPR